jgi:hypothetical protein
MSPNQTETEKEEAGNGAKMASRPVSGEQVNTGASASVHSRALLAEH